MDFSEVLKHLKQGKAAFRSAWGLSGTFIVVVPGSQIEVEEGRPLAEVLNTGVTIEYGSHIDMVTSGKVSPWTPRHEDLFADDWMVVG